MQIMQISISSKSRYGMRFVLSLRQSCKQRKRGLLFFRKAILSPLPRSAVEGTWTPTQVHGHEPESCAYANSATTAYSILFFLMICIRKMQLTGLEPVRARLTRSLVLRVCQFRHNCIFCFCLLSNFVCCFFVFSVAHLTIYILSHGQWFVNTFFKKNQKTFCRCLFVSQN